MNNYEISSYELFMNLIDMNNNKQQFGNVKTFTLTMNCD